MNNYEIEVILVEDNPEDAELAIRALKQHHLANKLIHLKDGAEALDFIYGSGAYAGNGIKNNPKVIFLDLKMPKVGGIEVLKRIKSDPMTKTIPVVILTSSGEDPDIEKCYELGASSYIVKPVEFDTFAKTVVELGLYWLLLNRLP
ncbi:MAG TPA: response regulator [Cytophagaceae bacterium]|jgi:two-component system response regulator|nr:response regulator [Cytophagaceae bacterium]